MASHTLAEKSAAPDVRKPHKRTHVNSRTMRSAAQRQPHLPYIAHAPRWRAPHSPVATCVADLFNFADHTAPLCPSKVPIQSPVSPSRSIGFLSAPATPHDALHRQTRARATAYTRAAMPTVMRVHGTARACSQGAALAHAPMLALTKNVPSSVTGE